MQHDLKHNKLNVLDRHILNFSLWNRVESIKGQSIVALTHLDKGTKAAWARMSRLTQHRGRHNSSIQCRPSHVVSTSVRETTHFVLNNNWPD